MLTNAERNRIIIVQVKGGQAISFWLNIWYVIRKLSDDVAKIASQ